MQYIILFLTTTGVWRECRQYCCTNGVHRPHNLPNVTRWIHQRREPRGGPACAVLRGFQISCSLAQFPIIYRVFMEKIFSFYFQLIRTATRTRRGGAVFTDSVLRAICYSSRSVNERRRFFWTSSSRLPAPIHLCDNYVTTIGFVASGVS